MNNLGEANRAKSLWSLLFNRTEFRYAILLLLTFILYGSTVRFDYNLDDNLVTRGHPRTSLGFQGVWDILRSPYFEDQEMGYAYEYRPVTHISFALEHALFGESPATSHTINLLLYGLTGILLLIFLRELEPDSPVPFLAAVLFMIHPIHVEVVSSIKNREEILALIGGLGAAVGCVRFIHSEKMLYLLLMSLCFAFGHYAKKSISSFAVGLPFMVSVFSQAPRKQLIYVTLPIALIVSTSLGGDMLYSWSSLVLIIVSSVILFNVAINDRAVLRDYVHNWLDSIKGKITSFNKKFCLKLLKLKIQAYTAIQFVKNTMILTEKLLQKSHRQHLSKLNRISFGENNKKWLNKNILVVVVSLFIATSILVFNPFRVNDYYNLLLSATVSLIPVICLSGIGFSLAVFAWSIFIVHSGFYDLYGEFIAPPIILTISLYPNKNNFLLNSATALILLLYSPDFVGVMLVSVCMVAFHYNGIGKTRYGWLSKLLLVGALASLFTFNFKVEVAGYIYILVVVWLFSVTYLEPSVAAMHLSLKLLLAFALSMVAFSYYSGFFQPYSSAHSEYESHIVAINHTVPGHAIVSAQLVRLKTTDNSMDEDRKLRPYNFLEFPVGFNPSLDKKLGTAAAVLGHYLKMMVFPWPQHFYYGFDMVPVVGMRDGRALASALIHLVLLLVCIYVGRNHPFLSTGLMIYLSSIFIFSNLVSPVAGMMADRLTYVASMGFCMVAAYLMHRLYLLTPSSFRPILAAAFLVLCSVSCYAVVKRASLWSDPITLMRHDLARDGRSAQGHNLLAFHLMSRSMDSRNAIERFDLQKEAIVHFRKAIAIYPYLVNFWYDLGRAYLTIGDEQRAFTSFKEAFDRDPSFPDSGIQAAILAFNTGHSDDATELLHKVVTLHPYLPEGHSLLGELLMAEGSNEKAADAYRAAIEIEPGWEWARKGLDNALLKSNPEKTPSP